MNVLRSLRLTLRWSVIALLLLGAATGVWMGKSPAAGGKGPTSATEAEPAAVCFGQVDVEGGVTALVPNRPGRVVAVEVQEGQVVRAGQVLLRLDDALPRLRLQETEAALQAAEYQVEQTRQLPGQHQAKRTQQAAVVEAVRHRLAAARHQRERQDELRRGNHISASQLAAAEEVVRELEAVERAEQGKLAELGFLDPEPAVRRGEVEVAACRNRQAQAQLALDDCLLKAPRPGSVLRLQVGVGDFLGGPGSSPPVLFCPNGARIVRAEVAQEFAAAVGLNAPCRILDDASGSLVWQGRVAHVSDWFAPRRLVLLEPAQLNDVRTLECKVRLDDGQAPLRIGQRVRVLVGRRSVP